MNRLRKFWTQITSIEYTVMLWRRIRRTEKSIATYRDLHDKELAVINKLLFRHQEMLRRIVPLLDADEIRVLEELNKRVEEQEAAAAKEAALLRKVADYNAKQSSVNPTV